MAWAINAVMKDPDGWASSANYAAGFKEVTAPDDKTVKIVMDNPIGNMEYRLSFLYAIYPKDFEQFKTPEDLQNLLTMPPLARGRLVIQRFDKDQGILILDTNTDYFDGRAKIDQVLPQTFDNADALVQALKVGDVDMMNEVPQTAFNTVKGFENVQAVQQPGRYLSELIINSAPADHDPAPKRNSA
ncbi:MAG: ABC transporter substrate-binding protein [Anaerolineae bacterium]